MAGIDRETGRILDGFQHVEQSIQVIFATRIGDRVMRRHFGSVGPALLGRLMTPRTVLIFKAALAVAIDLWEPRFRLSRVSVGRDAAEETRLGRLTLILEGQYLPRGHLGDRTSEEPRTLSLTLSGASGFAAS